MILFDRSWNGFWGDLKSTYSGFGNSLTVVGFIMVLIGIVYPDNSFPYLLHFGVVSIICIAIICLYHAWPNKVTKIDQYMGKHIPISEISQIYPLPFTVGVVGCSSSGKTTFLNKVNFNTGNLTRTNEIYATVLKLPSRFSEVKSEIVVVDGDGKNQSQQFDIMNHVDFLIIFLDHNDGDTSARVLNQRLDDHTKFMEQTMFHLKKCKKLKYIHLVLNKHDLWKNSADIDKLKTFFDNKLEELRKFSGLKVTGAFDHSNNESDCIAGVLEYTAIYLGEFKTDES